MTLITYHSLSLPLLLPWQKVIIPHVTPYLVWWKYAEQISRVGERCTSLCVSVGISQSFPYIGLKCQICTLLVFRRCHFLFSLSNCSLRQRLLFSQHKITVKDNRNFIRDSAYKCHWNGVLYCTVLHSAYAHTQSTHVETDTGTHPAVHMEMLRKTYTTQHNTTHIQKINSCIVIKSNKWSYLFFFYLFIFFCKFFQSAVFFCLYWYL